MEPKFKLAETPWDEGATTIYRFERRDGTEMTAADGGAVTLAAFGAGLTVLRAE